MKHRSMPTTVCLTALFCCHLAARAGQAPIAADRATNPAGLVTSDLTYPAHEGLSRPVNLNLNDDMLEPKDTAGRPRIVALAPNRPMLMPNDFLRVNVLVAIYTNYTLDANVYDHVTSTEIDYLKTRVAVAEEFYARNSRCRVDINTSYQIVDRALTLKQLQPGIWGDPHGYWLWPRTSDGVRSVETDLHDLGYTDNQFGSVFVFYAFEETDTAKAACGGAACGPEWGFMGQTAYAAVPLCWDSTGNDWLFVHEFHHNVDQMFNASGVPEYPHADNPIGYVGDFDDMYTFNALMLRDWPWNKWGLMSSSWGTVQSFVDADNDSLPDYGTGLALTEQTIGSSAGSVDTDADGLSDLGEATAGYFRGSDPNRQDTDGDGLLDGVDRYPYDSVKVRVPYTNPVIDGLIDCPSCIIARFIGQSSASMSATVYLSHNDSGVYVGVQVTDNIVSTPWDDPYVWFNDGIEIMLDATDDGFATHGNNNYSVRISPKGSATAPLTDWAILIPQGIGDWSTRDKTFIPQTDVRSAYTRQTSSYTIEVFIKTNALTHLGISPLDSVGLQVAISDYDDVYPNFPHYNGLSQFLRFGFVPKDITPPTSPNNLSAKLEDRSVTLSWNKNSEPDVLLYRIFGGVTPNPTTKIDSTTGGINDTTKVISGLDYGNVYNYRITAVDTAGNQSPYSGEVVVSPSCCVGLTGNVDCDPLDGSDISDLTALIDNLYISLTPLCCPAEANLDGSPDGNIDISDLTALIDYLYISFTPPATCQ